MENDEKSESSNSKYLNEEEEENSEMDPDCPTLFQINKMIDKKRREEEIKLIEKKRKRLKNETDIVYDANKKQLNDCFIPNLEELNNFLNNCTTRAINLYDIKNELKEISKEKIFDPDKFIEENYGKEEKDKNELKNNFSIEELGFKLDKKEEKINKEEELKENLEDIDKNKEKIILNDILQEKDLNKQKKDIHKLIEKIKKMNIEEIIKSQEGNANKKLNIVLDLDNTCIYAFPISQKDLSNLVIKYPRKELYGIIFQYFDKIILSASIVRKGLKEFFDFTKSFCNYFINTLGFEKYGLEIKKYLEEKFDIKFSGFKARNNEMERLKFLNDMFLGSKNTVIFDDKPMVWVEDNANVIMSKCFTDEEMNSDFLKKINLKNNKYLFLKNYGPFAYYKSSNENWLKQRLKFELECPFYNFNERNCFSGEYLDSSKYQFIYMKEVVKIIYYLIYNSNMRVPEALKMIRYNIFYNSCFNLNFYATGGKEILKEIIKNCGGIILENKNQNIKDMKLFIVCSSDEYNKCKDEIKKERIWMENAKVVSDIYILDCFYFMTNLENELNDPQYCLDLKGEDNYDDY